MTRAIFALSVILLASCNGDKQSTNLIHCTSNILQCRSYLNHFISEEKNLPNTSDTVGAFQTMGMPFGSNPDFPTIRFMGCPDAFEKYKTIGFIYVGSGIGSQRVTFGRPLILFCPAESHNGVANVLEGTEWSRLNNKEMIELLLSSIAKGEGKAMPYSTAALDIMRKEVEIRKRLKL